MDPGFRRDDDAFVNNRPFEDIHRPNANDRSRRNQRWIPAFAGMTMLS